MKKSFLFLLGFICIAIAMAGCTPPRRYGGSQNRPQPQQEDYDLEIISSIERTMEKKALKLSLDIQVYAYGQWEAFQLEFIKINRNGDDRAYQKIFVYGYLLETYYLNGISCTIVGGTEIVGVTESDYSNLLQDFSSPLDPSEDDGISEYSVKKVTTKSYTKYSATITNYDMSDFFQDLDITVGGGLGEFTADVYIDNEGLLQQMTFNFNFYSNQEDASMSCTMNVTTDTSSIAIPMPMIVHDAIMYYRSQNVNYSLLFK